MSPSFLSIDKTSPDISEALKRLVDPSLLIEDAFVDGQWLKEEKFDVWEPSTATTLGKVANRSLDDFKKTIETPYLTQPKFFAEMAGAACGAFLGKWYDLIIANQEDAALILCLENGKTLIEARGEVIHTASFISWFAEGGTRSYGVKNPSSYPNISLSTIRELIGVCAMITRKIIPPFAASCSVMIKPLSETPYTCLALARLAIEAGLPPATIHVSTNPRVRKVSFTSSTKVGKMLAKLSGGTLKLFDDADLDTTVEGTMFSKFRCSAQNNINKAAIKKIHEHITDALSKGAKVEFCDIPNDESVGKGDFCPRTVVPGITAEATVTNDESFGLLAPIFEFSTLVGVNTGKISAAEASFGGVKESGYGREGSLYGLEEYQTIESITAKDHSGSGPDLVVFNAIISALPPR
ncbi:ALDH-like protein [Viridothelium virens]|uniref:ALDH-like protein n=1 Tax=Viridothelium virens TaxID=1048519 RepID=A0A6A6GU03_VIRVR|nr:ALDH-like protein [Viridothelium virens]